MRREKCVNIYVYYEKIFVPLIVANVVTNVDDYFLTRVSSLRDNVYGIILCFDIRVFFCFADSNL